MHKGTPHRRCMEKDEVRVKQASSLGTSRDRGLRAPNSSGHALVVVVLRFHRHIIIASEDFKASRQKAGQSFGSKRLRITRNRVGCDSQQRAREQATSVGPARGRPRCITITAI